MTLGSDEGAELAVMPRSIEGSVTPTLNSERRSSARDQSMGVKDPN